MEQMNPREKIQRLAREAVERGNPTGWFEQLYAGAAGDASGIPWADLAPNPHLMSWIEQHAHTLRGKRALVVGCGLGDDAQALAALGMTVTAFDISSSAIEWCRQRFPDSPVRFLAADATDLPAAWRGAFDFVFEAYTLQVLVPALRRQAAEAVSACIAPGGLLLVVCRGREPADPIGDFPWPLTKVELDALADFGLTEVSFDDVMDGDTRRFRVLFRRNASPNM